MKILWHSNSPTVDSGYGDQTRIFAPRIKKLGHQVKISAFYGLVGWNIPANEDGIEVYGSIAYDVWGNAVLQGHAERAFGGNARGGLVLTLIDAWVFEPEILKKLNAACWTPVDCQPVPPMVVDNLRKSGAIPIAMSRFGEEELKAAKLNPLYVPHAIETDVLKPVPRAAALADFGLPEDTFLVTMVGANRSSPAPTRKGFEIALQAFRVFMDRHDDAILWLQTDVQGREQGMDLGPLMANLGYPRGTGKARHRAPVQYDYLTGGWKKTPHMQRLYSASDVLLQPSAGEGFGIPIIEAQACGCPVIVSDFTAMPELVGAGWKIGGKRRWTNIHAWQWDASVDDTIDLLEEAYKVRGDQTVREQARNFALGYDADKIAKEHWIPTLEAIGRRTGL